MKKSILAFLAVLALSASVIPVQAATSLIVNPQSNRNNFTGVIGYRFTSNDANTVVNYLGFVDDGENGLSASHNIGLYLWNGSAYALERTVTVSAGTSAVLHNGYRWASIPSITLSNTGVTFWLLTATVTSGDGDRWGDADLGSVGSLDPAIGSLNLAPGAAGYYDGANTNITSPNLYFGPGAGFYGFYNAPNLATAIPEPTSSALVLLGGVALLRRRR